VAAPPPQADSTMATSTSMLNNLNLFIRLHLLFRCYLDLELHKPGERTMSYSLYGASFVRIFAISENRAQNDEFDVLSCGTRFYRWI
jgi:hypothetical protein